MCSYVNDSSVRAKWDYLHTHLRCCGANKYTTFAGQSKAYKCVPASCCWNYKTDGDCTNQIVLGKYLSTYLE